MNRLRKMRLDLGLFYEPESRSELAEQAAVKRRNFRNSLPNIISDLYYYIFFQNDRRGTIS